MNRKNVVSWTHKKCIICLSETKLSSEHIFPANMLGQLECNFLCAKCNSDLGSRLDSKIIRDHRIRYNYLRIASSIGQNKISKLENGQHYKARGQNGPIAGRRKNGEFLPSTMNYFDKSKVLRESKATREIVAVLKSEKKSDTEIAKFISDFRKAKKGVSLSPTESLLVTKLELTDIEPDLINSYSPLDLFALKIAYEFSAILLGQSIYRSEFDSIRSTLGGAKDLGCFSSEILEANCNIPIHGVYFEGNLPAATFQIRLFGRLAIRIGFQSIALNCERTSYTLDLRSMHGRFRTLP